MEINRPVMIEFNYYNNDNELAPDVDLTFRTTSDMRIGELHRFCKIFAITLGYSPECVEEIFGENTEDGF